MFETKYALFLSVFLISFLAGGIASAQGDSLDINVDWKGNPDVLNISITGAPPNADIEVIVEELPDHAPEPPNGDPPDKTDGEGNWPGEEAGGEVGYPGTAPDPPGTQYIIRTIINGQSGPAMGVTKPRGFFYFFSRVGRFLTFGLVDRKSIDTAPIQAPRILPGSDPILLIIRNRGRFIANHLV